MVAMADLAVYKSGKYVGTKFCQIRHSQNRFAPQLYISVCKQLAEIENFAVWNLTEVVKFG